MTVSLFGETDALDSIVSELRKYTGWPVDDTRDRVYVAELQEKFPTVDLSEEAFHWRTWMLENETRKEVKPRARFLTWVRNAASFRADRQNKSKNRKNQSRTAPAGRDQFGGESSTSLSRW